MKKAILWVEQNINENTKGFFIENLQDFGRFEDEPFAYYIEKSDDEYHWSVTLDDFEDFGNVESPKQAREKIMSALEKKFNLYGLPHYALSKVEGMYLDGGKYILQKFDLDSWVPSHTWFIHQVREGGVIKQFNVYHAESGNVESFPYEGIMFDCVNFTKKYIIL